MPDTPIFSEKELVRLRYIEYYHLVKTRFPGQFDTLLDPDSSPMELFKFINLDFFSSMSFPFSFFSKNGDTDYLFELPCIQIWKILDDCHLLNGSKAETNFNAVASCANLIKLLQALILLMNHRFLQDGSGQTIFELIIAYGAPLAAAEVLCFLKKHHLFMPENALEICTAIAARSDLEDFLVALRCMPVDKLLQCDGGRANVNVLLASEDAMATSLLLFYMDYAGLLGGKIAKEVRDLLLKHKKPSELACACSELYELHQSGLLSNKHRKNNFRSLLRHPDPSQIMERLAILQVQPSSSNPVRVQAEFNAIMKNNTAGGPTVSSKKRSFSFFNTDNLASESDHLFTQEDLNDIATLCRS